MTQPSHRRQLANALRPAAGLVAPEANLLQRREQPMLPGRLRSWAPMRPNLRNAVSWPLLPGQLLTWCPGRPSRCNAVSYPQVVSTIHLTRGPGRGRPGSKVYRVILVHTGPKDKAPGYQPGQLPLPSGVLRSRAPLRPNLRSAWSWPRCSAKLLG